MGQEAETNTKNFTAGAGSLYLARLNEDGLPDEDGEIYLGDSDGFSYNPETESLEKWTGDGPTRQKAIDVVTSITREFQMVVNEVTPENFALAFYGSVDVLEQSDDTGISEGFNSVQQGSWYSFGVTTDNPFGDRNITNVIVDDGDEQTYEEGVDYELDAEMGKIKILDGAIEDDDDIEVEYDRPAEDYVQMTTSEEANEPRWLLYKENARAGKNRDIIIPRVEVAPAGEIQFKDPDSAQQITLSAEALLPTNGMPAVIMQDRDPS